MGNITLSALEGGAVEVSEEAVEGLQAGFRGQLCMPGDEGYEEGRSIWNAMIDRKPGMIARCVGTKDVIDSVNFARENGVLVSVKGGGHNIAGNALNDGGLLIDLSQMKSVRVDPGIKKVYVEPGAILGDLDHETQAFGLATPVGINSTTGVAGLTLGGGFGWLSRKYGLTVDNLVSVDLVTADGSFMKASAQENPDLFWALRGGGGNFGVVTLFEFNLYEVGPEVLAGLMVFDFDQADTILKKYHDYSESMTDDLNVWVVLRKAPPLPFLPEDVHGKEVVVLAMCYAGDPKDGEAEIAPLRGFGNMHGEHVGVLPYVGWQQAFDPLLTPGARNYWKTHNFSELKESALDSMIEYASKLPDPQCEIFIGLLGGATERIDPGATAFSRRDVKFVLNVHARWDSAADDDKCISWAREFYESTLQHATGTAYVNFMTHEESDRVKEAYGAHYEKLVDLKTKYDPMNLFRLNHNIKPR